MYGKKVNVWCCLSAVVLLAGSAMGGNVINSVPDWHQPCLIGAPNGPDNGANPGAGQACYKAWCVPSAASNVMGYWRDVKGCNKIADGAVYASGAVIAWNPPVPTDWQDDGADASSIPTVGGGARGAGADLGWYLNTNDQGDQTLASAGGGETFTGTKIADIQSGLTNYLTAAGYPANSVVYSACTQQVGWGTITTEIDAGRPLLGVFMHGAFSETGPGDWDWDPNYDPVDSQTGEEWGPGATGHVMTIVGYLNVGDAGNPHVNMDAIIVQDNRIHNIGGAAEATNNFCQHVLPFFNTATQQGVGPWVGYVSIDVPEPATLSLLTLGALAALQRGRRR